MICGDDTLKLKLSRAKGILQHPAADGFIGDVRPTLGQEILDVSVAEREAQVEPDGMLDDNRREAVAAI
jgi:hypothetical protein